MVLFLYLKLWKSQVSVTSERGEGITSHVTSRLSWLWDLPTRRLSLGPSWPSGCEVAPLLSPDPLKHPRASRAEVEEQLVRSAKPGWAACWRSWGNARALGGEGTALTRVLHCRGREGFDMREYLWLGRGLAPLSAASQRQLFCNCNETSKAVFCNTCPNFSSKPSSRDRDISKAFSELFICRGTSRHN